MPETFGNLFEKGYRARQERRVTESRAVFLDIVRRAAECGDKQALAQAFCCLAEAEDDIGNCEAAGHHYANAAILYREIGPQISVAFAVRHEADIRRQMRQLSEAESLYVEAETIYRRSGHEASLELANTLRGLALTREASGIPETPRELWIEARDLYAQNYVQAGVEECNKKLSQT